ncbi:MAG: hypothetical protein JSW39_21265 [Desulfobacterales bacterium]|nr:MAG: hypothetical protein JSW39_21265 [Desulfobacterales bacterium]
MTDRGFWALITGCVLGLLLSAATPCPAADCGQLHLVRRDRQYDRYPRYEAFCPGGRGQIRCHRYHGHWVCARGDTLYWDRRLEAAAHAACGCPLPDDVAAASPAISGRPREDIFAPEAR